MNKMIRIALICGFSLVLCGCSVVSRQEEKNITLSVEHEALCDSKNTLNKKLCRQTMGQLPKFENDVNAYFKEKFHIDGFKLTGINFPYDGFNHGGFHATFQLESDPYVMVSNLFDYNKDNNGKYTIRNQNNEESSVPGELSLAYAILDAEFSKTLPIQKLEKDMQELGFETNKQRTLYYGSSGNYFSEHNLINRTSYFGGDERILKEDRKSLISNYIEKKSNEKYRTEYERILLKKYKFAPITYAVSEDDIRKKYEKFIYYIDNNQEHSELFELRIVFYMINNLSVERFITENRGEVKIDEL